MRLLKLFIMAIIPCILLAGCEVPYSDSYWVDYIYHLEIFSENQTVQYQIFLPIPINETDMTPPEFLDSLLVVEGNFNFRINQTFFGPALEIIGIGDIELDITFNNQSDDPVTGPQNLSMLDEFLEDDEIGFFWIYSDQENISVHLTYWFSESDPDFEFTDLNYGIISMLNPGWQRAPATIVIWESIE